MIAIGISDGHDWGADLCFLLATILAVVAIALALLERRPYRAVEHRADGTLAPIVADGGWSRLAVWAALALIALGWLIL